MSAGDNTSKNAIKVQLGGGRGYPVIVGSGVLAQAAQYAAPRNVIITNPTVRALYADALMDALRGGGREGVILTIGDGEAHKNMNTLQQLLDDMLALPLGRDDGVIALGGGVVGDVAGFAAAVYMRGISLLQIPTTLLAQVDAAIGGKTGVNHPGGKNLIGAFHQPRAVLADINTLATLPARERRAGLAEVVKYGLLGDAAFFARLEAQPDALQNGDAAALEEVIAASARHKAAIVSADETEHSGQRALLNLGHTFAHAAEAVCGYGEWLHGEAVSFGLVAAARLSEKITGFAAADTARIIALLTALRLPVRAPAGAAVDELLAAMGVDKKNKGGQKRFILMRGIGDAYQSDLGEAPDRAVREVLEDLQ